MNLKNICEKNNYKTIIYMRSYRKKYRKNNKRGGLFGLTRTSKYREVKTSNEALQQQILEKDAIIAKKDEEIEELNKEIKQLDWDLKSSKQQYKSLRDSNPSSPNSSPTPSPKVSFDIQETETMSPIKENKCTQGECNIMGGKKTKRGGLFGLTTTSKYRDVKSSNEQLKNEIATLNEEVKNCGETSQRKDDMIKILNDKIAELQKETDKDKNKIGLLEGTCVAGECKITEGGRKTRKNKRKSKGKSRKY